MSYVIGAGKADCPEGYYHTEEGIVCRNTGEVISDSIISDGPEWRNFPNQGQTKGLVRAGTPVTFRTHNQGLGVDLEPHGRPGLHSRGTGRVARGFRASRRRGSVLPGEKPLVDLLVRLNNAAKLLGVPDGIVETAAGMLTEYHRKAKNLGSSRDRDALVAAALSKAVELYNWGLPQSRILELLGVSEAMVWSAKKRLYEAGALSLYKYRPAGDRLLARVQVFAEMITRQLGLDMKVYRLAMEFVKASLRETRKNLYGKKPETVAAAAVYLAARLLGHEDINQAKIAETVGIKESNVRKLYRYLIDNMVILVPL
ncbi:MAG: transcription initiation factor IIB family protein [Desulfurococcales archaeon]|nr:transcription initiation factor IIB family protein [Desulfurococcales archaeon]